MLFINWSQVPLSLGPDLASNNASLGVQLMGAPWISPVPFSIPGPYAHQTKALIKAKCSERYASGSVDIVASSTCDSGRAQRWAENYNGAASGQATMH